MLCLAIHKNKGKQEWDYLLGVSDNSIPDEWGFLVCFERGVNEDYLLTNCFTFGHFSVVIGHIHIFKFTGVSICNFEIMENKTDYRKHLYSY